MARAMVVAMARAIATAMALVIAIVSHTMVWSIV